MISVLAGPAPISSVLHDGIVAGGGRIVPATMAEVVIWEDHRGLGLKETLAGAPQVKWVQVASAGVDWLFDQDIYSDSRVWTCAKGDVFAATVAEMGLLLLLAGFRELRRYVGATSWLPMAGRSLSGSRICIVGAGGVGRALLELLQPFNVEAVVVRRSTGPVPGASRVVGPADLHETVRDVDAVILAAPLTRDTRHLIDGAALRAFKPGAWLVNISRGGLVDTEALLAELDSGHLAGAALDVTDPEPLPPGHRLWSHPQVIITPHVSNIDDLSGEAFAERVRRNLRLWEAGEALLGRVDPQLGY